jgi:PAS domain S-box-containing protein
MRLSEGWTVAGVMRAGAGAGIAVHALTYRPLADHPAPSYVLPASIGLAAVVALLAAAQIRRPSSRAVAIAGALVDVAVAVALLYLYAFDPRRYLYALLLPVEVEAAIMLGLTRGIAVWAAASAAYFGRELVSDQDLFAIDPSGIAARIGAGLLVVVVTGALVRTLERERRWFLALLETAPDAVVVSDQASNIVLVNRAAEELFGCTKEALLSRSVNQLVPEEQRELHERLHDEYVAHPRVRPMGALTELTALRCDGEEIPVQIALSPVDTDEGYTTAIVRDITLLKLAEEERRRQDERYRMLAGNMREIVYLLETPSLDRPRPVLVDGAVRGVTGHGPEDFIDDPELWQELVHPEDRQPALDAIVRMFETKEPIVRRYRIRNDTLGTYRTIEDRTVPEMGPGGEVARVFGVARDITDAATAEAALLESEARYRSLVESMPGVVYQEEYGGKEHVIYVSPGVEEMLGLTREEVLLQPHSLSSSVHPDDRDRVKELSRRSYETGHLDEEFRMIRKDGRAIWVREVASVIRDEAGHPICWQGLILDITAAREAEEELRLSYAMLRDVAEKRRRLVGQVAEAQEEARRQLAQGIHDDAVQKMVALELRLSMLHDSEQDLERRAQLETAGELMRQTIGSLRHLIFELQPPSLDSAGLEAAMRELLYRVEQESGLQWSLRVALGDEPPSGLRAFVYRVVQELVTNVRKHASATQVRIEVSREGEEIVATVSDDGVGMDREQALTPRPGHLGLPVLCERIDSAGGSCSMDSAPGRGTTITFRIPASVTSA